MDYKDAGFLITESLGEEGTPVAVVRCTGCGALVLNGHSSREAHDAFHAALSDLFDTMETAKNWIESQVEEGYVFPVEAASDAATGDNRG